MPDLTTYQSAEFFTIRVHNYKDDPGHDNVSLHGLFTDRAEAERIAHAVSVGWDFIAADVVPVQSSAIASMAAAQRISHIEPDLPADFIDATPPAAPSEEVCTHPNCGEHGKSPVEGLGCDGLTDDEREETIEGIAHDSAYHDGYEGDERTSETQPAPAMETEASLRQEFLDLSAEIGAAKDRRCTYLYPGEEFLGACGINDYVHGPEYSHPFQDDLTERFAAHVARHEAFKAQWEALAQVVHEADWMMAGPRWPWHQATNTQRTDALVIAQYALADPTMSEDALEALVERFWSTKPKHGAPRRVAAKASKIREWLISEGLRESIDRPADRS